MSPASFVLPIFCLPVFVLGADQPEQPKDLRDNAKSAFSATGEDITRIPTRAGLSYDSAVNDKEKSNTDRYLLTGSAAIYGLQGVAEFPLMTRYNPGEGQTVSGIGDTFVSGSFAFPLSPKLRLVGGMDTTLDTASKTGLGADETIYAPYIGAAVELDKDNMVMARFSYTKGSDSDVEHGDILVRGLHRWNAQLFTSAEVTPGWDAEGKRFTLRARVLAGARIDQHNTSSIETGQPLDGHGRDAAGWNLRLNYTFVF